MQFSTNCGGATRHFAPPAPEYKRGHAERPDSPLKTRPGEPLYIVGEGLDWSWYDWQVDAVIEDYEAGVAFSEIVRRLNRDYREVAYLIMELAEFGRIKPRRSGVYGRT